MTATESQRAYLDTATTGPRTVPVRSSIAGVKAPECSRPCRASDVLRAGTARAPAAVSRCAPAQPRGRGVEPGASPQGNGGETAEPATRTCDGILTRLIH